MEAGLIQTNEIKFEFKECDELLALFSSIGKNI
jgi:hypothetical protein